MAAGEGVGGVDVAIAGAAEDGGVRLASDGSGSLLAHLAHPHALVLHHRRRYLGGGIVQLGVASHAHETGVGAAEEQRRGGLAVAAGFRRHIPYCGKTLRLDSSAATV